MKRYLAAVLATAIILPACKNDNTEHEQYVNKKEDSLSVLIATRDSMINNLLVSFNQIEQNLDSLEIKQNILSIDVQKQKGDIKGNAKDRINSMITGLNTIIVQNRKKINELNGKLKKNFAKINELQKMITGLNEEIAEKNSSLQLLNEQLAMANGHLLQLQSSVDTLMSNNSSQSQTIAAQTAYMHTAFYVIGKSKKLEEMKVIDKKGGLLGMGKTSKINSDLDKKSFTKIDYTNVMTIPINSKKAEIVTSHPNDSYVLEKGSKENTYTNLHIIEPEKFWSESKYLVIIN